MGRRGDQFCWDNAEKVGGDKWRCKHCKTEFSGSASRIRNHLSGKANDISACTKVPPHIQQEAVNTSSKKRGRKSSSGDSTVANSSLDMANLLSSSNKASIEEDPTDDLVKFSMSRYVPVNAFKDPHFMTFLSRVAQHGVPPQLLRDDSLWIQKSVSNLEHEINEYMLMVSQCWKTMGCRMISYRLNQGKAEPSVLDESNVVFGFYCPKGFIFVEGRQLDLSNGIVAAMKNHVLNLPMEDVTQFCSHDDDSMCELAHDFIPPHRCPHSDDSLCELGHDDLIDDDDFIDPDPYDIDEACVLDLITQFWRLTCWGGKYEPGIDWVRNLIQNSETLYQEILIKAYFDKERRQEDMVEKDADNVMFTSSFKHLRSVMRRQDKFKSWLGNGVRSFTTTRVVREIINNNEFWSNGKQLLEALNPLMEIIDLLDTIVPTTAYLMVAMDKAKCSIKTYSDREVSKYRGIWDLFNERFNDKTLIGYKVAAYLNPALNWIRGRVEDHTEQEEDHTKQEELLRSMVRVEERQQLDAELEVYRSNNNPFANLDIMVQHKNPVELWNKYGDKFPVLHKYAIKFLGLPASCMCNQVKKQMNRIQGADNVTLRLNYNMREEFTKKGDKIYKNLSEEFYLRKWWSTPPWRIVAPSYAGDIPVFMHHFVDDYVNVVGDGNCGFRAIAHALGHGQDGWGLVRNQMREHVKNNNTLYSDFYEKNLNTLSNVEKLKEAIEWPHPGPAPQEKWFSGWDMGHVVATTFQLVFVIHNIHQSTTFLPLFKSDIEDINKEIHVGFLHKEQHYIWLQMRQQACPLPVVAREWMSMHTIEDGLLALYSERMLRWMDLSKKRSTHARGSHSHTL